MRVMPHAGLPPSPDVDVDVDADIDIDAEASLTSATEIISGSRVNRSGTRFASAWSVQSCATTVASLLAAAHTNSGL